MSERKFMRIIVIFDLPTTTKAERKMAHNFRKSLIDSGFKMLQYSIYVRICNGMSVVHRQKNRIQAFLPSKGSVRMLILTNKQYEAMEVLVGKMTDQEVDVGEKQLILL